MANETFSCGLCGKTYVRKKALSNHIQFIHGKAYECKTCGAKLSSKARLARHSQSKNCVKKKEKKTYVCHFCQETFTKKSELNKHFKTNHKAKRKLKVKKTKLPSSYEFFETDKDALPCLHKAEGDDHQRATVKETWQ